MRYRWSWVQSVMFVSLAGFMWLGACQAQTHVQRFKMLESGAFAGTGKQGYQCEVLRDRNQFEIIYREIHKNRLPAPPIPEVDFQRNAVLFFSLDTRPTAGNSVDVEEVIRNGNRLDVRLKIMEPCKESIQAQVITKPFVMVAIEPYSGVEDVRFIDHKAKILCNSAW